MNIVTTIKFEWDKSAGEKLLDFKKKVDAFKRHITIMQVKGLMPIGEVRYVVGRKTNPIVLPPPKEENPGMCLIPIRDGEWFVRDM